MNPPPSPEAANTCAVVVTFHPDDNLPERVRALAGQVARVFVVDNGSGASPSLDRLEDVPDIRTVRNVENLGIATALNQGLALAARDGFPWAVTMDQDSAVLPEFGAILFRTFRQHPERGRIGVIGSAYRDPSVDLARYQRALPPGATHREVRTVITSGCLTSVAAWAEAGPFREEFFIDCVDEDFCLRLRRRGWLAVMPLEVGLVHRLGEMREYHLLGRTWVATNHSALRRYYMTRNAATLIAANIFREPLWAARKLQRQLGEWMGILAAESDKPRKIRAVLLGLCHALTRRAGPVPPQVAARLVPPPDSGQK